MKLIAQGAEAKIYSDSETITKERFEKKYRIKEIDGKLRKSRSKREAKILKRLEELKFPAPRLIELEDNNIRMQRIKGKRVRDVLTKENISLCREIGKLVRKLHEHGIVHADLTTSNMILGDKVYLIDFGLSFFSLKTEDKAVDLHLFKEALESKHYKIWEKCFEEFATGYGDKEVMNRLKKVEMRGKYKGKSS